jgi:holo-[acyl-carrier protein] synthase
MVVGQTVSLIGLGIDLVDLERVRRMLEQASMPCIGSYRRRARVSRHRPDPTGHAAARMAAKAVTRRCNLPGARAIGWQDIEVTRDEEGRPAIRLHRVAEQPRRSRAVRIQVSLTHSSTAAGAVAVVSTAA